MDIKIEKENAFTVIVKIKKFNEETSFEDIPKFLDEYYEKGYHNVVPPMLGMCNSNAGSLEFVIRVSNNDYKYFKIYYLK